MEKSVLYVKLKKTTSKSKRCLQALLVLFIYSTLKGLDMWWGYLVFNPSSLLISHRQQQIRQNLIIIESGGEAIVFLFLDVFQRRCQVN